MKALAITSKGIEDISALEIKELINAKTEIKESCVIFEPKRLEDLCLLCYKAQSIDKVLFLFDNFIFNNANFFNELKKIIDKIDFSEWLDKKVKFRVSCKKINNALSTEEICSKTGEFIIDKVKKTKKYQQKVDLSNPDVIFLVYIFNNNCYFGIDFSGLDLHKRQYRIFMHASSLRATIAYSLLRIAKYKPNETILDPFTGAGTIPIEAALYSSNFPVNYFNKDNFSFLKFKNLKIDFNEFFEGIDKKIKKTKSKIYGYDSVLGYITNAKKNAKIAGINKQINLSRVDVEWLDTKFDKESVDKIVANPPDLSKNVNPKDIEKVYNELFYQAEFILKKNGRIVLIAKDLDLLKKYAEKYKFKSKEERVVYSGKAALKVGVFER